MRRSVRNVLTMHSIQRARIVGLGSFVALALSPAAAQAQNSVNIHRATLMEADQKTPDLSTEELRQILREKSATVFDARPFNEYAISHIPGAVNVAAKPGVAASLYVSDTAEIGRVVKEDKAAAIVLYCNGPFCGKSKRLATELLEAGYTNVRRYQLGIPVWRALGEVTQIEQAGIQRVVANDRTAVLIDCRDGADFKLGSIPGAKNLPVSLVKEGKDVGEVKVAKDDGRLPMEDHNTRIIVFGKTAVESTKVAQAIAKEAFHNVSFFDGTVDQLKATLSR
jgi:rhodanese-related sulfurtransferase